MLTPVVTPPQNTTSMKTASAKETTKHKTIKAAAKKAAPKKAATKTAKATAAKKETTFTPHATSLKEGDKAPAFSAIDQNGKTVSLNDFKGKNLVLYFYPKDNTPGCTAEACSLRDEYKFLGKKNYAVVGVSADDEKMHKKFAAKYELPFPLLADTDKKIISAYDVWGTKQFMGRIFDGIIRTTFIINEKGIIKHIIQKVYTKEHGKQILAL